MKISLGIPEEFSGNCKMGYDIVRIFTLHYLKKKGIFDITNRRKVV